MNALLAAQIILGIILIIAVTIQSQTGGLGSAFGSTGSYHTKRGLETSLHYLTIIVAVLFTAVSIVILTL